MSQRRYSNFGSTVSSSALNALHATFLTKGVLRGGTISITAPNILVISPISLVFPSGIVLSETENTSLVVPFSAINTDFTITYRHNDGGLVGGTGATLQAEPGFISNDNPALADGVAIAYVKYPGTGPLLLAHIYEAAQLTLDAAVTPGDGDFRLPPFGEGFILAGQTPPSPVITPTVTANPDTQATYLYTNGAGGILFTAVVPGAGGNDISFGFINGSGANQPETITAVTSTQFTITLATDAGSLPSSTMSSMVAFLMTAPVTPALTAFRNAVSVVTTGNSAAAVAEFPPGNTGSEFQSLSGGVTNGSIFYLIENTDLVPITHTLKWVFVARKQIPNSVVIEFSLGGTSTITISVIDTNGNVVGLDSPTDLIQSSGLTRRTFRITDGDFISGQRYYIQASILTQAGEFSTLTLVGTSHYNLPF